VADYKTIAESKTFIVVDQYTREWKKLDSLEQIKARKQVPMPNNPFSQLIAHASCQPRRVRAASAVHREKPHTKTEALRAYLREVGRATAADLAMEADLANTGLVWALLKGDIAKGAVERRANQYIWNFDFDEEKQRDISEAIHLLKSAGYSVTKT
jgi:hypothetical protein